ncbi:MAG: hypothetical protein Fur0032_24200 [Terrimicrobiaceae bacterium]
MIDSYKGRIFRIRFPLTDGADVKKRPALALTEPDAFGDILWAFITTKPHEGSIPLETLHLCEGQLPRASYLCPDKLFTISKDRIDHYYAKTTAQFQASLSKRSALQHSRSFSQLTHTANRPGDDPTRLAAEAAAYGCGKPDGMPISGAHGSKSLSESVPPSTHSSSTSTDSATVSVPYAGRVFTEDEVEAAVSATLDFWLTLGPEGEVFEKELANFLGVKHCLLVNSGSSANLVAISALTTHKLPEHKRIRPGDEVITVAAGFPTTVAPIVQVGAIPVFIDANPVTGNADCSQLEAAYSPGKTKAVMMAHALGNPFDLATTLAFCKKYDLWLIEDNCDALGCTYSLPVDLARDLGLDHLLKIAETGTHPLISVQPSPATRHSPPVTLLTAPTGAWGDLSTQSFYPPHHLTMGEGGAVSIIRRASLKSYAESFRDWGRDCWCPSGKDNTCAKRFGWQLGELPHGYDHKYIYSHLGYNLKPLDPQAAIGRVQLRRLPAFIEARKANWEALRRGLAHLENYLEFALPTHATAWLSPSGELSVGGSQLLGSAREAGPSGKDPTTNNQQLTTSNFSWDSSCCHSDCSWFGFKITVKPGAPFSRTELARHLDEHKIGNRMLFGGNLVRQPAFVQLRRDNPDAFRIVPSPGSSPESPLPGADQIMNNTIFLGTYPGLTPNQIQYMIRVISEFADSMRDGEKQLLSNTGSPAER